MIWDRDLDDVMCLWPEEKDVTELSEKSNNLIPSIIFKAERERNGTYPFLDVLTVKFKKGCVLKVDRKPIHAIILLT